MVRISDARMCGTADGTVVLHAAPEAAVGGPLALVETRRHIELDVRSAGCTARGRHGTRASAHALDAAARARARMGEAILRYRDAGRHGVDLDFLVGASGAKVGRESH